ncbi:hypothetical protein Tco_0973755 [Tanacetum coccineum]|uniref:Uncharacterized protein n=1 Tax=Tanacetum coccineum TaxID=301880 RepID=A0ABQ5E9M6_9ASTR
MNYMTMDMFTKGVLWDYWKLGSDEVEPTNKKTLNIKETNQDDEQKIDEIFRIETNLFDYETLMLESWDDFESTNDDRNEWKYENEHEDNERYELCGNETHELPVCNIRRFEMIKYSFGQDEEYVAVKENEYEDLMSTSEDAWRAYH